MLAVLATLALAEECVNFSVNNCSVASLGCKWNEVNGTCVTAGCTLSNKAVVPVGWSGDGEGDNACNSCSCMPNNLLTCTELDCDNESCELGDMIVPGGWEYNSTKTVDGCEACLCQKGAIVCSKIPCDKTDCADSVRFCPRLECDIVPKQAYCSLTECVPDCYGCLLANNTNVPENWSGKVVEDDACSLCSCMDTELTCTRTACDEMRQCPDGNSVPKSDVCKEPTHSTLFVFAIVVAVCTLIVLAAFLVKACHKYRSNIDEEVV